MPRTCDPQQDKPPQWKSLALQLESSLLSPEKFGMLWSMGSPSVRQDWAGTHVLINQYELVATFSPYYVCNRSSLIAQLVKNPPASRRPQLDSWIGKVCYRRDGLPTPEFICNAGDLGSIPGLGRSPGEGKGYPLQYSGLENSMDSTVHGVAKSWKRLSNFHFHFTSMSATLVSKWFNDFSSQRFGSTPSWSWCCIDWFMIGHVISQI